MSMIWCDMTNVWMQFFPAHVFLKVFLHDLQIPFAQIFPTTERASESMIITRWVWTCDQSYPSREMIAKTCIFWYGTYWTTLKLIKKVGHLLQCKHVSWSHLDSFFGFINQRMLDTRTTQHHDTTQNHRCLSPLGDLDQQELWRDDWSRKDTWLVRRLSDM